MRTSNVISISLPPTLVLETKRLAKKQHMTYSELLRTALREYVETPAATKAIGVYKTELAGKKLKKLKGSLSSLMG